MVTKLASAIYNDVVGGLAGYTSTPTMSLEQLEDEVIEERLLIIKEYMMRNMIPFNDLAMSINCVPVDCESLDKCPCDDSSGKPELHFEIPQTITDIQNKGIIYIGTTDRSKPFKLYTNNTFNYHKYSKRGTNKPYVYINTTPNENNKFDGWVFNSPFLEKISVTGIFKDIRQLIDYDCCKNDDIENYNFISTEIKKRLIEKKLRYYRQFLPQVQPNNQVYK